MCVPCTLWVPCSFSVCCRPGILFSSMLTLLVCTTCRLLRHCSSSWQSSTGRWNWLTARLQRQLPCQSSKQVTKCLRLKTQWGQSGFRKARQSFNNACGVDAGASKAASVAPSVVASVAGSVDTSSLPASSGSSPVESGNHSVGAAAAHPAMHSPQLHTSQAAFLP